MQKQGGERLRYVTSCLMYKSINTKREKKKNINTYSNISSGKINKGALNHGFLGGVFIKNALNTETFRNIHYFLVIRMYFSHKAENPLLHSTRCTLLSLRIQNWCFVLITRSEIQKLIKIRRGQFTAAFKICICQNKREMSSWSI